jgi:hypothetical protein
LKYQDNDHTLISLLPFWWSDLRIDYSWYHSQIFQLVSMILNSFWWLETCWLTSEKGGGRSISLIQRLFLINCSEIRCGFIKLLSIIICLLKMKNEIGKISKEVTHLQNLLLKNSQRTLIKISCK